MALTLNNIDINVKYGYEAADSVSDAASDLHAAYSEGLSLIEDLRGSWTGDNATRFLALLEERTNAFNTRANKLDEIAKAMRDTVALYEQDQKNQYYEEKRKREEAEEKKRQEKKNKKK